VAVTGIPVASAFARPADRAAARLALGLSPRLPVLLLMAGSAGRLGRLEEAAKTLLQIEEPFEAVLVAGREERVEERLRSLVAGREARIKVFGYVDDVPQLMAAADFIVSKAGGVTLAEALAAELPIICFGSLPGQEARNARFATMAGVALVTPSAAHLHRVVAAALRHPVLLHDIRDRVRLYRRPHAARSIVNLVLERRRPARERAS
jgi:processive 1,2-diacylglycerol beta-glucosyltransferase